MTGRRGDEIAKVTAELAALLAEAEVVAAALAAALPAEEEEQDPEGGDLVDS